MKKVLLRIFLGVLIVTQLVGCAKSAPAATPAGAASEKKYIIRMSYVVAEAQSTHVGAQEVFKKYVEEASGGRISVELYPNGQLYSGDRQAIEAVQLGTIEMTIPAAAVLSGFEPKFQVFDLPYLFKDKEQAYAALDGELGTKLNELLLNQGLVNLAYGENGFRHVMNNIKPIHTPADLKGLKIRTMENPVQIGIFKALGANPTPMSFGELYTALQQKTVEGGENPVPLVYTSKFYEVQKYYSLNGHQYAPTVVLINQDYFNSLPEDLQGIVKTGAEKFRDEQRIINGKQEEEFMVQLKENGMEINTITDEEKALFVEATNSVYDEFADVIGEELMGIAKDIRSK